MTLITPNFALKHHFFLSKSSKSEFEKAKEFTWFFADSTMSVTYY